MENRNQDPQKRTHRTAAPAGPEGSDGAAAVADVEDPNERQKRALNLGKGKQRSEPRPNENRSSENNENEVARAEGVEEEGGNQKRTDEPDELEQARAELASVQDQLKRQAAEFQNYRRRTAQEKNMLVDYGKGLVLQHLLGVVDDFGRSKEAAEKLEGQENVETAYQALKQGVDLVYDKFMSELARQGVEPIEAVGKPFDEHEHEAMLQQPAPEGTESGMVLQEVQKGYRLGDRVLRHSKVIVSA